MRQLVVAAAIAAGIVAAGAGAGTNAARQRVAITTTPTTAVKTFVLEPLTEGRLKRDSGTVTWHRENERTLIRDGQQVDHWVGVGTFVGKYGTIVIRSRIDWLDAGRGHDAGVGTWKVIRGTRDYARVAGSGKSAHVWLPSGAAASRAEGFMVEEGR